MYEENKSDSLINLTDNYTLEEFSYLIKMASVIVTGDTVALHMSISLGTKIVSFSNHGGIEKGPGNTGTNNPKLRNLQLGGHVGFDSLPDQLVNQSVAAGFTFNIMCIGKMS